MERIIQLLTLLLLLVCSQVSATTVRYQHTDMLGSVVAESDSAGNITSRSHYEPFGKRLGGDKAGIGYTGHLQDEDLNLTYMQARYYDPLIGRFYADDPVGFRDVYSFNRYTYANNNPYKYVDPDGEFALALFAPPPPVVGQTGGNVKAPNITKQDVVSGAIRTGNPIVAVVAIILTAEQGNSENQSNNEGKTGPHSSEERALQDMLNGDTRRGNRLSNDDADAYIDLAEEMGNKTSDHRGEKGRQGGGNENHWKRVFKILCHVKNHRSM
ncbi:RHS repeat-associated core domain-containing protein [Shewanella indica]|uniref:RHS repeat-associated core domain-containing protein n=1 Tax=Shewanella indica TaxID=768528 RepID=A0ABU4QAW4_9GAMM|nr:RHS repeat-associated core domain-containing protein [Shewanella indica]MDX6016577.1 RHS repeat-associated core domain-containing protein [Shewanella indica]